MAYQTRPRAMGTNPRLASAEAASAREGRQVLAAEGVTFPLIVGVVHLLIVQTVASLAWRFGSQDSRGSEPFFWRERYPDGMALDGVWDTLVGPMRVWDGLWYKSIADLGYASCSPPACDDNYVLDTTTPAFWPLFPWLMAAGERITGLPTEVVGWLIANFAFVVALGVIYRLIQIDFDRNVARRTLWAIALFPTALFFTAVYTESLFLALAAGALLAARTRNWALAGLIGLLASLTRSQGVMLLVPFAVLFLQQYGWNPLRWLPRALFAALPVLGPILFYVHLDSQDVPQEPTNPAYVEVQAQWWRFSATPWETIDCAVSGCTAPTDHEYITTFEGENGELVGFPVQGADWGWVETLAEDPSWDTVTAPDFRIAFGDSSTVELVSLVLFVALAVCGLWRLPLYQSAYLWPPLLIPLFSPSAQNPLMSVPRFGIVLFPLFVVLALVLNDRKWAIPAAVVSTVLLVVFTAQFANWYWVS